MIGVSIEMARQRLGWSGTTGTLEHCHSLLGRWVQYSDFEEDVLWNTKPVKTGERIHHVFRTTNTNEKPSCG